MRLSADVGGTFTDLVIEHEDGRFELFKAPTTSDDPVRGVFRRARARGRRGRRPARRAARELRPLHARDDARDERGAHRRHLPGRLHDDEGTSRRPAAARGRPGRPLRQHRALSPSRWCRGGSPSRCRGGSGPTASSTSPSTTRSPSRSSGACARPTSRRWGCACSGRSSIRPTRSGSALSSMRTCRASPTRSPTA